MAEDRDQDSLLNYADPIVPSDPWRSERINYRAQQSLLCGLLAIIAGVILMMGAPFLVMLVIWSALALAAVALGLASFASPTRVIRKWMGIGGLLLGVGNLLYVAGVIVAVMMVRGHQQKAYTVYRAQCAKNLQHIAQALSSYEGRHRGFLPAQLSELVLNEDMEFAGDFVCPAGPDSRATAETPKALAAELTGNHLSYIYLGKGIRHGDDPSTVILYERLANHRDGINVLLLDGRVKFCEQPAAGKLIQDTQVAGGPVVYKLK